mmetsp:Transcript_26514/g.64619  ORF Transcript_26514/g.64619 Transcript_26514/m.64619 type:complete len:81 (-) Transcript_26514:51-293(-)
MLGFSLELPAWERLQIGRAVLIWQCNQAPASCLLLQDGSLSETGSTCKLKKKKSTRLRIEGTSCSNVNVNVRVLSDPSEH